MKKPGVLTKRFGRTAKWLEEQHFKATYGASSPELTDRDISLRNIFYRLGKIPNRRKPVEHNTDHLSNRTIIALNNKQTSNHAEMFAKETFGAIGVIILSAPIYFSLGTDWQRAAWVACGGSLLGVLKYMHSSYLTYQENRNKLNAEAEELLFPDTLPLE